MLSLPPETPRPTPIEVRRHSEWNITDSRLGAYEKCPLRFFYTHILSLGAARKRTAFSRTHDCLYELIHWLTEARLTANPTLAETMVAFKKIWQERGPLDHAFCEDYQRLALRLIATLVRAGEGQRFLKAIPLAIEFANGRVLVEPNELAELSDGTVTVRRLRTGHKRSDEYDRLEYALYQLAAEAHYGRGAVVQAFHLTDEKAESVTISETKLRNRRTRSDEMLSRIVAGWFPTEPDPVSCPRCPHFFICAARPWGPLILP
jgi:hypothetical protein